MPNYTNGFFKKQIQHCLNHTQFVVISVHLKKSHKYQTAIKKLESMYGGGGGGGGFHIMTINKYTGKGSEARREIP